ATPSGTLPSDAVYTWNFGDGGTGSGQTVSHTFTSGGTYFVQVHIGSASNPSFTPSGQLQLLVSGQAGATVPYQVGWNLVGGAGGPVFAQADGPLYTYQAGDTNYESVPNSTGIVGGRGYWAYLTQTTTVSLNGTGGPTLPLSISAP